jgi:hypothetical protein
MNNIEEIQKVVDKVMAEIVKEKINIGWSKKDALVFARCAAENLLNSFCNYTLSLDDEVLRRIER